MPRATPQQQSGPEVNSAVTEAAGPLKSWQRQMLDSLLSARSKHELVQRCASIIADIIRPVALIYFERGEQGEFLEFFRAGVEPDGDRAERRDSQLLAACRVACQKGEIEVRRKAMPARWILAAPIPQHGAAPEALGIVFSGSEAELPLLLVIQLVACHCVLWQESEREKSAHREAHELAAVVELLGKMQTASNSREAACMLANELQRHLACDRVAIGLRRGARGPCQLAAISGVARFDKRSETVRTMEAAMDEAVAHGDVTYWSSAGDMQQHGTLAHQRLCTLDAALQAVSLPLRDGDGRICGVATQLDGSLQESHQRNNYLTALARPLGTSLCLIQRLEPRGPLRVVQRAGSWCRRGKAVIALSAVVLLVAALAIPVPFRVHGDCRLEPVTRRFVAAPFEGILEKALVKPGDVVQQGKVLARLDDREIRWKRASVVADRNQAVKKRDAAQVAHNYGQAQIAILEMQRLDLELRLLDYRAEHLEVKSPVAGIVTSGDLERAEGAPLTVGQTMFEIAPLETMIVEQAVADEDVSFVKPGQAIAVRLDAYPAETFRATIIRVQPRSEIRDDRNVFIAEAELDNRGESLRPGMKGRGKVETGRRVLGWILFHKPWEFLIKKLQW